MVALNAPAKRLGISLADSAPRFHFIIENFKFRKQDRRLKGIKATIQGVGPYTVFVPTDGAFSLLESGTIANMSAAEKKRLVQYHVVSGRAIDPDAVKSGQIMALSKDVLNFEVSTTDKTARVNNSFFIKAYQGRNGIVYLVSAVLLPPESTTP